MITTCLAAAFLNPDEVAQDGLKVTPHIASLSGGQLIQQLHV